MYINLFQINLKKKIKKFEVPRLKFEVKILGYRRVKKTCLPETASYYDF